MHSSESDREKEKAARPNLRVVRGNPDARNGEIALAREYARRALAPIITDLRNRHGHLDPGRLASALGMTTQQLAECLELSPELLRHPSEPDDMETRLEPFAMVVAVVRDVYGGDSARIRAWLRTPRPELDGRTPNQALCERGGLHEVTQFVVGAWLGNAD